MTALKVTPLHPALGAEIAGVDLSRPIDASTREALSQRARGSSGARVSRSVADARRSISPPRRCSDRRWSSTTGSTTCRTIPLIGLIWHRNGQQPAERWHTDHTNRERPPAATILYGVEIPSAGGGTSVASMRAAYTALPADERRRLEGLTTFNSLDSGRDRHAARGRGEVRQADPASDGAHPSGARLARRCTSTSPRPRTSTA